MNDIAPGGGNTPGAKKMSDGNLNKEHEEVMKAKTEQFMQM